LDKTCIIAGNGPSLNNVPTRLLEKWQGNSWGSNSIGLHDWFRPRFYVNTDKASLETELGRDVAATACRSASIAYILRDYCQRMASEYELHNIVPIFHFNSVYGKSKFIENAPVTGFATSGTVTFVVMQYAYASGYNTFLMVGLDHTYGGIQPHFYDDKLTPPYAHKNDAENIAWREKCDVGFQRVRQFLEERGGRVVNLTEAETTTDIFEKDKAENWL